MSIIKLPEEYKNTLEIVVKKISELFGENLLNITLGGSGGKSEIIVGHSDLDLYVILQKIDISLISQVIDFIERLPIHIGITYYTKYQMDHKLIDSKTKIMIYEKYNYNVNPSLYKEFDFPMIDYSEVIENDKNNLPNLNHVLTRECAYAFKDIKRMDSKFVKKMFVLIKCFLNTEGIFSYGYKRSLKLFQENVADEHIKNYKIDIVNILTNIDSNREIVLDFSLKVLDYINSRVEE